MTMARTIDDLKRYPLPALVVGLVGAVAAVAGGIANLPWLLHAYLTAYFFWLSLALGCLAVLLLQNLTGGYWGAVMRRFLEAGAGTLPLLAALFLPVIAGLRVLYPWVDPQSYAGIALPAFKQAYLSVPFWIGRAVVYFAIWIVLGQTAIHWSKARDANPDPAFTRRLRNLAAPGLVLVGLTVTFAAFDWLMSLEPAWASSIYGAMVSMGALLTGFAFAIALTTWLAEREPLAGLVSPEALNRMGSLLLAFLMLWAYLAFSQFLLIYAGNLPAEAIWYVRRITGRWLAVGLVVVVFHFILPFCVLIMRDLKRKRPVLGATALLLVAADYVNLYWLIRPAFAGPGFTWLDAVLPIAIGGMWLAGFTWLLGRTPLVARYDPQLIQGMEGTS